MKSKYYTVSDGEVIKVPKANILYVQCCDCGLVHQFKFKNHRRRIKITRDNRRTGQIRRYRNIVIGEHT
jgi:uncharacterized Zn finger protein